MKLNLNVVNHQSVKLNTKEIQSLAERIWSDEGKTAANIDVILVDDVFIRDLNKRFFEKDSATDVIAFPYSEENEEIFEGEIYVSVERVMDNARHYNVELDEELKRVVVHGILHFLGYCDRTKSHKQCMTKRENHYLNLE